VVRDHKAFTRAPGSVGSIRTENGPIGRVGSPRTDNGPVGLGHVSQPPTPAGAGAVRQERLISPKKHHIRELHDDVA
jgi:hypothetical protein